MGSPMAPMHLVVRMVAERKGSRMATQRSKAMASSMAESVPEKVWMKKSCRKQVAAAAFLWPRRKTAATEGSVEAERPRSATESLERKRDEWRLGTDWTVCVMLMLPSKERT